MSRHHYQLADNLPLLQNLIKRDPASYQDEFLRQYDNFQSMIELFAINPNRPNEVLEDLIMFLAQIYKCYPNEMNGFPAQLKGLLQTQATVINNRMRFVICKALILLRNRGSLDAFDILKLFFELLGCNDKVLRKFLETHIIQDIKKMNQKHNNEKINRMLQNFMYSMLNEKNAKAAKMSLNVMIALYKKNVWHDSKTVNIIASGCFSKFPKVMVCSLKFFATADQNDNKDASDSDSDDGNHVPDAKQVVMANKVNKKTRKRQRMLEKTKKQIIKNQKKTVNEYGLFSAIHLVNDPQEIAEQLFRQLESTNKRFEVKLLTLDVISKLIGVHGLLVLNFYAYIQRYLQPHQREVTKILLFAAQSSHSLVPPDAIDPLIRSIVNNFVTERNSSDAMAIGLNSIREICLRCPLAMSKDLLQDLIQYRNVHEKSVMMAARSLLQLFRIERPDLLKRKDRGKPTQVQIDYVPKKYAQVDVQEGVDGLNAATERILDDEDFKNIEIARLRKQIGVVNDDGDDDDDNADDSVEMKRKLEEQESDDDNNEIVKLDRIENIYKKRKHDKESRVQSVRDGQLNRDKFGYKDGRKNPYCSKTNNEKKRNKNFQMLKPKLKSKSLKSFQEKQQRVRKHLLQQQKLR